MKTTNNPSVRFPVDEAGARLDMESPDRNDWRGWASLKSRELRTGEVLLENAEAVMLVPGNYGVLRVRGRLVGDVRIWRDRDVEDIVGQLKRLRDEKGKV